MTTWTGEQDNHQKQREDQNRLRAIGPNLGDYTQWVRIRAPTGSKVSRLEEGDKETNQAILGTRPESRGLHPAGTQVYLREAEPSDLRKARRKKQSKVGKAYRVVAVNLLKVLGHGHGEI